MKGKPQVGDMVESYVRLTSGKKQKVVGTIKTVEDFIGKKLYTITNGTIDDFKTRSVKHVQHKSTKESK